MPEDKTQKKLPDDNIVPIAVGNPSRAASLTIDQSQLDEYFGDGKSESSVIKLDKPPKGIYFTVLPEPDPKKWKNRGFYWVLEIEGRDTFFVTNEIVEQKKDEDVLRPVLIVRYVIMAGIEGLWPIKLNPPEGRANLWNSSARNILNIADGTTAVPGREAGPKWVRLKSGKGHYVHKVSPKTIKDTPPSFSDRTFFELIDTASEGHTIDTLDHEIWKALDEGSQS